MLSCLCGEDNGEGWVYKHPDDFTTLQTSKRKRCCSCKELIDIGSTCLEFTRSRYASTEIEVKIYGDDEIDIASWWMCEKCGEIYLNLSAAEFCLDIEYPMQEYLEEYHEITGFRRE